MQDDALFFEEKPWSRRKRAKPARTWSGEVVYKRGKHYWTQKDLARIADKVIIEPRPDQTARNFWDEIILLFQKVTLALLERIFPMVSEETIANLYYSIYRLLGRIMGIDTTGYDAPGKDSVLFNMIVELASKAGYEITLKRKV